MAGSWLVPADFCPPFVSPGLVLAGSRLVLTDFWQAHDWFWHVVSRVIGSFGSAPVISAGIGVTPVVAHRMVGIGRMGSGYVTYHLLPLVERVSRYALACKG